MAATRGHFDCETYYSALDEIRKAKVLSWKKVSDLTKVSASTLTRMGQGKHPDADSLTMLSAWAGLNPADFVSDEGFRHKTAESLPKMMALLRADPTLTTDSIEALQELLQVAYRRFTKPALEDAAIVREAAARL